MNAKERVMAVLNHQKPDRMPCFGANSTVTYEQMEQVQAELAARTVEATSGGGAVKVTAKCDGTIGAVKIDPQAMDPSDAQLLEDMIMAAANQALGQAKEISNEEMGKVTAGMNLPGMM